MSLVYITYHNENVCNLEEQDVYKEPKEPRYNSRYKRNVVAAAQKREIKQTNDGTLLLSSAKKSERKTMGMAEIPLQTPQQFLRKQSGIKWQRQPEHVCVREQRLPPLPRCQRAASSANQRSCNFIKLNIERVKGAVAQRPPLRYVDTAKGERHDLLNTGLIPQYVQFAKYGKVPKYIRRRQQTAQQRQIVDTPIYMGSGKQIMPQEERQRLLNGLKTNFTELTRKYQGLSLFTDTVAKKQRKTNIEQQLRQLEQDIYLIERNPNIYITAY